MQRLYGGLKMKWLTVILFAVITGVYTGAVMLVPALEGTSFRDIGVSYEWWVIFAVIVVVNCDKSWEAMLKCFVFFLISQPLVYAVEVVFGHMPVDTAIYYYRIWLTPTILTIPGGFIAYFCKKQNLAGSVILGLGNTIQAVMGSYYLAAAIRNFPHHLLSAIVSFASIIWMSLLIQKKTKHRVVSMVLPMILLMIVAVMAKMTGRTFL